MPKLTKALRRHRRHQWWVIGLGIVSAALVTWSGFDRRDALFVGIGVALILAYLIAGIYCHFSRRFRPPASDEAMVFDAEGATFHLVGRPRVRLAWGTFALDTKWAPWQTVFVRHGRKKLRFRIEWLDAHADAIGEVATRASAGRVVVTHQS